MLRILLVACATLSVAACKAPAAGGSSEPFADDFNRTELGDRWAKAGTWRIEDGKLWSRGDRNEALWLKYDLPRDVQIEFDAQSAVPAVDIKCELYGNGRDHQSGYVIINGGWNNSVSIIARLAEHELDEVPVGSVPYKRAAGLSPNKVYQWKIVRRGNVITQFLDGEKDLERKDDDGLYSPNNNKFAFNNWSALVWFDNLKITPLPAE